MGAHQKRWQPGTGVIEKVFDRVHAANIDIIYSVAGGRLVGWLVGWWVDGLVGWWVGGLMGWWVDGLMG